VGCQLAIKKLITGLAAFAAFGSVQAATVLSQGFDNVSALSGQGWVFTNNSAAPVGQNWFQGNPGIFPAAQGAPDSYAAANFLSSGAATGAVSNWLITPALTLDASSVISFYVRNGGEDFLDKLEVRMSFGSGTDVGSTTTSVGSFTTLLGGYQSAVTPGGWIGLSYGLAGLDAPTTVRLAFRYIVDDVATAGNYLGIDSLNVTAVPEPATYVLMGLGVAGLVLRRRFSA
jgi:hypothetical protein